MERACWTAKKTGKKMPALPRVSQESVRGDYPSLFPSLPPVVFLPDNDNMDNTSSNDTDTHVYKRIDNCRVHASILLSQRRSIFFRDAKIYFIYIIRNNRRRLVDNTSAGCKKNAECIGFPAGYPPRFIDQLVRAQA